MKTSRLLPARFLVNCINLPYRWVFIMLFLQILCTMLQRKRSLLMKWQWKLGTFAGIDVFIHATFLLLIGWIGYSHWLQYGTIAKVAEGILFILALFLCVVL